MTASAVPAFLRATVAETPLGRPGTVDEVAPLVAFLLVDDAVVHHRRRDPRRRRPDRPRRRQVDLRRAPHPRPYHRRTLMFEYFPGNYVWNLGVVADAEQRRARSTRSTAPAGRSGRRRAAARTPAPPEFLRAWTALTDQLVGAGRGGREGRAHPHRRADVLPRHQLPVPGRADAERTPTRPAARPTGGAGPAQKAFDLTARGLRGSRSPTRATTLPAYFSQAPPTATTAPRR